MRILLVRTGRRAGLVEGEELRPPAKKATLIS